jgi:AcrR family transcriptional regulator
MVAPRPPGDGTGRPPKGDRRRKLLAAAKRLFAERGYAATSLDDIAAAAGVSPALLTRSFADKPAFLRAVGEDLIRTAFAPAEEPEEGRPDPLAQLHQLGERVLTAARDPARLEARAVLRVLAESEELPAEVSGVLFESLAEGVGAVAGVIQAGQQAGVFRRSLDPGAAGWELLRALLGSLLLEPLAGRFPPEADSPGASLDCFLHGILKTDV